MDNKTRIRSESQGRFAADDRIVGFRPMERNKVMAGSMIAPADGP